MRRLLAPMIGVLIAVMELNPALAAEVNYQDPITAAPPISRPDTTSCTVSVMQNHQFANSYSHPFTGTYNPPANCPGPWSKVVLDWSGSVAGRQYDRIAGVWFGGVEMLRTSTPEPDPAGISWHVSKDVSEYSSVLSQPQNVVVELDNIYNSTYTGIYDMSLSLTFYETDAQNPAAPHPQQVVPIAASTTTSAGWNYLFSPTDAASGSVTFPTNLTQAYLEVYASAHSCDEFWYTNQPNDYASTESQYGLCGGGAFREIQVSIDGKLAGVAWPYPVIYTGGVNPLLWRPIPGVNAFNIPPYRVNLTPFVGLLNDGQPHTISIRVANNDGFWLVDGNLLLNTDPNVTQTTGTLTTDTASPDAVETTQENANTKGGTFDTTATRSLTFAGTVTSSAGTVTTTVHQDFAFTNSQVLNLVNFRENVKSEEDLATTTTTVDGTGKTTVQTVKRVYPVTVDSMFQVPQQGNGHLFILPGSVQQGLSRTETDSVNGSSTFSSSLSDQVSGTALLSRSLSGGQTQVATGSTREDYIYSDSTGFCYNRHLAAAQGYVTADTLKNTC